MSRYIERWDILVEHIDIDDELKDAFHALVEQRSALLEALKRIAVIGGNLPDDKHEGRTGPNDAHSRGIMYTTSRSIANEAIRKAEGVD